MRVNIGQKTYAEKNHPNTCLAGEALPPNYIIIAKGEYELEILECNTNGILVTDNKGNASYIPVPSGSAGYNKVLGTDNNGVLTWLDIE